MPSKPCGPAVEADRLSRVFTAKGRPKVVALDEVSITVERGEVHGLLGPNGAGKTTLVKLLSTILLPSSGTGRVLGLDVVAEPAAVRPLIGIVLGGERGLYNRLTARQNLRYWCALYKMNAAMGRTRTEAMLERVGLLDRADDRVQTYSRGMRQRLHLARGLLHDPPVVFLDEPSTGLDPVAARDLRAILSELTHEGRTVLITTHDMVEAEAVCDRVTLIDKGKLLATETPHTLSKTLSRFERIECEGADDAVLTVLQSFEGVSQVSKTMAGARIEVNAESAVGHVMRHLVESGVTSVKVTRPTLEEVYLTLVGERGMDV